MGYIKLSGVVVKEVNTGEADKIITLLTKSHGKISAYAKGARRPKSQFVSSTQFLCYSDFVLYKGKDMYNISSCDVIESFYNIRNDISKLTYSAHFAELINNLIEEERSSGRVLQLFLNTVHFLSTTDRSQDLLARVFELRLISILGHSPHVKNCMQCGNADAEDYYFGYKKCGILCGNCYLVDTSAYKITSGTTKALEYILHAPLKNIFCFKLSDNILQELKIICKRYLKERFDKDFIKLDFLKEFK